MCALLVRVYPNNDLIFDVVGRKMGIADTCQMAVCFSFLFFYYFTYSDELRVDSVYEFARKYG